MAPLLAHRSADRSFERIYQRYALDVYRYAYAVLHNQADAEDVAQTTFLNAYRALEGGERPENPHNWLIAIAHNVCRQRFRQQSRRVQEVGLEVDVADIVGVEDDDAPTPADITRALGHLAFNQRAALVMRELEGRSYAEIAEVLGLGLSAVETLIFRARRALRERLECSLTCGQAEHFLSKKLDGELGRGERPQLRAHLRECPSCRRLARSQRAHQKALRALGPVALPSSLASLFGGGGAAALATKVAAVVVASSVAAGGVGYGAHELMQPKPGRTPAPAKADVEPTRPLRTPPIAGVAIAQRSHRVRRAAVVQRTAAEQRRAVVRTVGRPTHTRVPGQAVPLDPQPQRQPQPQPPVAPPRRPGAGESAPPAAHDGPPPARRSGWQPHGRATGGEPHRPPPAVQLPEVNVPPPPPVAPPPAVPAVPVDVLSPPVATSPLPGLGH